MHFRHLSFQAWLALNSIYDCAAAATTSQESSVASPSPTSTVDPNLIGTYLGVGSETYAIYCSDLGPDGPFTSSSTYGNCCDGGYCDLATDCQNGIVYYTDFSGPCPIDLQCETMTIFDNYPYPSQSWIFPGCFAGLSQNTVYENILTTDSTVSTTTIVITTTARTSFITVSPPTSSLTPITSPTTSAKPVNNQRSSSKAWIAGAVVGPIAFVAVVGVLAFWFLRGRREPIPTGDQRPVSGQIGYVRSMPPAISNSK